MNHNFSEDTICSIITGGGKSAIAVIRISGNKSIEITDSIFSKDIKEVNSHTIHHGNIKDINLIDEVLVTIFKENKSFTGEESVEISCHGSIFIQEKIINILIKKGCRLAKEGEFTMRAFKNGKLDLLQAEAIADLINSENPQTHKNALNQLRGKLSNRLQSLRNKLIEFSSLIELELDFSEENVEFAKREELKKLLEYLSKNITELISSFKLGNAIKRGIPIAILGSPNVGKSTLLNTLLEEDKAIVSEIPGTTRDLIEDTITINNLLFRFIDTAGIRESKDQIEKIGIKKSLEIASKSEVILFVIDPTMNLKQQIKEYKEIQKLYNKKTMIISNKNDLKKSIKLNENYISISAKNRSGIEILKTKLVNFINKQHNTDSEYIINNVRHIEELHLTLKEIENILSGIEQNISIDLLSVNIRQALFHLGMITGEITTDDLLDNIFSKFCIGK